MNLTRDTRGMVIQSFAPKGGKTITAGAYVPTSNETIILGNVTDITLDNIIVSYPAGTVVILLQGVSYTFGTDTPVHSM